MREIKSCQLQSLPGQALGELPRPAADLQDILIRAGVNQPLEQIDFFPVPEMPGRGESPPPGGLGLFHQAVEMFFFFPAHFP